jgi:hypothetical protein
MSNPDFGTIRTTHKLLPYCAMLAREVLGSDVADKTSLQFSTGYLTCLGS